MSASVVWFVRLIDRPRPTYHDWPADWRWTGKTYCGQSMKGGVFVRLDLAEKIGRPCLRCWGEGS